MSALSVRKVTIAVLSLLSLSAAGQQDKPDQILSAIKEKVQEVQVDKSTFRQSIDILDAGKGKLRFVSSLTDEKGRTETGSYEFYISDLDKNTIIRKTSGKKLFVSMTVNNSQKFIRYYKGEKTDSYTNNLEILMSSADEASVLADLFREAIPLVKSAEIKWGTGRDAMTWLKDNISGTGLEAPAAEQAFGFGEKKEYLAFFTRKTDQKGTRTEERYDFNILDIDAKSLTIKVSGTVLSVSVGCRGKNSYFRYERNSELQNYQDNFEILSGDVEQARMIISALTAASEKSVQPMPDFGTLQKATDYLSGSVTDITSDKKTTGQKMSFTSGNGTSTSYVSAEADSKGKTVEERYEFYLSDIDASSLNFRVSGKKITIGCIPAGKAKLIKFYRDNNLQDFQNAVELLFPDIESARGAVEALKAAVKASVAGPLALKSTDDAVKFLTGALAGEPEGTEKYKLTFSSVSNDPLNVRYVTAKTDEKGATAEQAVEFYPYMLDPATIKISSSGKFLNVEAGVAGKKSLIKVFRDGRQQSYTDDIKLMASDSRQAREISDALRFMILNGKPKDKTWTGREEVFSFISSGITDIKAEGKEIKQKIEKINNDPCRMSLKTTTTDEKGKSTDEIFEFTLSDLNKQMTDVKVSGKDVMVVLVCTNKQKLVKVYRNGEQQAWGTGVEISVNDVEAARNISEAFRNAISLCGTK